MIANDCAYNIVGNVDGMDAASEQIITGINFNEIVVAADATGDDRLEKWELEYDPADNSRVRFKNLGYENPFLFMGVMQISAGQYIANLTPEPGYNFRLEKDGTDPQNQIIYNIKFDSAILGLQNYLTMVTPYKGNSISFDRRKRIQADRKTQRWKFKTVKKDDLMPPSGY